jgi:hypothetical protein
VASNLRKTKPLYFYLQFFFEVPESHQKLNSPSDVIDASLFPHKIPKKFCPSADEGNDYASLKKSFDEVTDLMLTL